MVVILILFPRVVTKYLTVSSNISTNSSVSGYQDQLPVSQSAQVNGKFVNEISSIVSYNDLGPWTSERGLYGSNVFISK